MERTQRLSPAQLRKGAGGEEASGRPPTPPGTPHPPTDPHATELASLARQTPEQLAHGQTLAAGPTTKSPLQPGSVLADRYEVQSELGRGGMGVVYKAHDRKLARGVALKVLHGELRTSSSRARIRREARTAAGIRHPNVVNIFDIGQVGEHDYIAMELIDGVDLRTWLGDPTLTWQQIVRVFLAAGEGLCAAHAQGLVHRDFKPDNVLIERSGRVRVLDFGLARPIADDEVADAHETIAHTKTIDLGVVTRTGALIGTPAYMAPEQFQGALIDARTDVFCFCVALHEALYGHRPFRANSVTELALQVESGTIVPATPMRESRPPNGLRQLLIQGLNPQREARPELPLLLRELEGWIRERKNRWPLLALVSLGAIVAVALTQLPGGPSPLAGAATSSGTAEATPEVASEPPAKAADIVAPTDGQKAASEPPAITWDATFADQPCNQPWHLELSGTWPEALSPRLAWRGQKQDVFTYIVATSASPRSIEISPAQHKNRAIEYYVELIDDGRNSAASLATQAAPRELAAPDCPAKSPIRRWCYTNPNMAGERKCWQSRSKCEKDAREWLGPGRRRCRGER